MYQSVGVYVLSAKFELFYMHTLLHFNLNLFFSFPAWWAHPSTQDAVCPSYSGIFRTLDCVQ